MSAIRLSIIIPVVNEAQRLAALVSHCRVLPGVVEVIVVDGHSEDDSVAQAVAAGAQVVHSSRRQRAAQMNAGAALAQGDILLFVHADTVISAASMQSVLRAMTDDRLVGGAFRRRFRSASWFLHWTSRLADWRVQGLGSSLGDQVQFVRRRVFQVLGGFTLLPRMEDLDFAKRLHRYGPTVLLGPPVISSARRFARGAMRQSVGDAWCLWRYWLFKDLS